MISMINISDFNEIVKGIKAMKADLVLVNGNTLYGTDNNFTTLKTYVMDSTILVEPFTIITKTLSSKFYSSIIDVYINIDTDINKIYCASNKYAVEDYPEMISTAINDNIYSIINNLKFSTNNPLCKIVELGEITNDIYFEEFKTIKSGEGARLYTPTGNIEYGLYLYSGAIPFTKSDKIYLRIYDEGNVFIGNFQVIKKKHNPINLYFRYVKLNKYRV